MSDSPAIPPATSPPPAAASTSETSLTLAARSTSGLLTGQALLDAFTAHGWDVDHSWARDAASRFVLDTQRHQILPFVPWNRAFDRSDTNKLKLLLKQGRLLYWHWVASKLNLVTTFDTVYIHRACVVIDRTVRPWHVV